MPKGRNPATDSYSDSIDKRAGAFEIEGRGIFLEEGRGILLDLEGAKEGVLLKEPATPPFLVTFEVFFEYWAGLAITPASPANPRKRRVDAEFELDGRLGPGCLKLSAESFFSFC